VASKPTQAASVGWKLETQLGQGGQGDVFLAVRATQPGGQKHAFKFLNDKGSPKARERFRQELKALTTIDHPGMVKVVQYAQPADTFQYYVMEYVDGAENLGKRIARNTNPFFKDPLRAVEGYIQIVEALAACEKHRVVHRDLSPANVLVTNEGRILLIDFGLCHFEDGQPITLAEEAVGTPHYRAPECSGHSQQEPTTHSDLYSAGKILWSMITNKPAFDRENPVFSHLSLASIFPAVPMSWHLHLIFEKTIRHDARNRYANTADALEWARRVRGLIIDRYKPLEQLADTLCPMCGLGRHRNTIGLLTYFAKEMEEFGRCMKPVSGSYAVCPYCFHASFVAMEALEKALADRKKLL
jgi:serine/threonine-protein kinase